MEIEYLNPSNESLDELELLNPQTDEYEQKKREIRLLQPVGTHLNNLEQEHGYKSINYTLNEEKTHVKGLWLIVGVCDKTNRHIIIHTVTGNIYQLDSSIIPYIYDNFNFYEDVGYERMFIQGEYEDLYTSDCVVRVTQSVREELGNGKWRKTAKEVIKPKDLGVMVGVYLDGDEHLTECDVYSGTVRTPFTRVTGNYILYPQIENILATYTGYMFHIKETQSSHMCKQESGTNMAIVGLHNQKTHEHEMVQVFSSGSLIGKPCIIRDKECKTCIKLHNMDFGSRLDKVEEDHIKFIIFDKFPSLDEIRTVAWSNIDGRHVYYVNRQNDLTPTQEEDVVRFCGYHGISLIKTNIHDNDIIAVLSTHRNFGKSKYMSYTTLMTHKREYIELPPNVTLLQAGINQTVNPTSLVYTKTDTTIQNPFIYFGVHEEGENSNTYGLKSGDTHIIRANVKHFKSYKEAVEYSKVLKDTISNRNKHTDTRDSKVVIFGYFFNSDCSGQTIPCRYTMHNDVFNLIHMAPSWIRITKPNE